MKDMTTVSFPTGEYVVVHKGEPVAFMAPDGRTVNRTQKEGMFASLAKVFDAALFTHPPKPAQDNAVLIEALEIGLDLAICDGTETDVAKMKAAIASLNVGQPVQEG